MKKLFRHGVPILLTLALLFAAPAAASAPETAGADQATEQVQRSSSAPGRISGREEVIYANLDNSGGVELVYAVTILDVEAAGRLLDHGEFSAVRNLTDTGALSLTADAIDFSADAGRFYYQGDLISRQLPWTVSITYLLDGRPVEASDLSGASGDLEIQISIAQDPAVNNVYFDNYLLQISVTLSTERCSRILAPGATAANSGSDKLLTFMVMPGSSADFTVQAAVEDFAMDGIQLSALPLSFQLEGVDTGEYLGELDALSSAIAQLSGGAAALADGTRQLSAGADDFGGGLTALAASGAELRAASQTVYQGLSALQEALSGAEEGGLDLRALAALPEGLVQLSGGLRQIASALDALSDGLKSANAAMDAAAAALPQSPADLSALQTSADADVQALLAAYMELYTAAQTLRGSWDAARPAYAAAEEAMPSLSAQLVSLAESIDGLSAQLDAAMDENTVLAGLAQLAEGLEALVAGYGDFQTGLNSYLDGVGQLSAGYGAVSGGLNRLDSGAAQLAEGAAQLEAGTEGLDDQVQETVDDILDSFDRSDFRPPSFTSPKNGEADSVQFVLKTAGIPAAEKTVAAPVEAETPGFRDRFLALFQ